MIDFLPIAKKMYTAYCEAVGGKAYNGDKLPDTEELFNDPTKQKQANAWLAAAHAAGDELIK